jgi:4-amino-4-deoxy-L-arabinose transferase-like glycosyltransferase
VDVVRERAGAVRGVGGKPFQPALLCLIWFAAIFVFFSLSGSKLPGYIVPVFPALAILVAVALDQINDGRGCARSTRCWCCRWPAYRRAVRGHAGNETNPNAVFRAFAVYVGVAFAVLLAGMLLARRLLRAAACCRASPRSRWPCS